MVGGVNTPIQMKTTEKTICKYCKGATNKGQYCSIECTEKMQKHRNIIDHQIHLEKIHKQKPTEEQHNTLNKIKQLISNHDITGANGKISQTANKKILFRSKVCDTKNQIYRQKLRRPNKVHHYLHPFAGWLC
jgi:hypothetical protein